MEDEHNGEEFARWALLGMSLQREGALPVSVCCGQCPRAPGEIIRGWNQHKVEYLFKQSIIDE